MGRTRFVKIDSADPKAVAQAQALIRLLYDVHESSRTTPLHRVRKTVRFRELETVLAYNYRGGPLTEDAAGREDLPIVIQHMLRISRSPNLSQAIHDWARWWAPWCSSGDLDAMIADAAANPRIWTADELAAELGVTDATRTALGLTTIGAIDFNKEQQKQRRKDRKREAEADRRRENGAVTRAEYLAAMKSRAKPWLEHGESRSTYFRRLKQCETGSVDSNKRGNTAVHGPSLKTLPSWNNPSRSAGRSLKRRPGAYLTMTSSYCS